MLSPIIVNADTITEYYRTDYDENGNIVFKGIVTENEYYSDICLLSSYESEYKKITLTTNQNIVKLVVSWKKRPKYTSYDVIAIRGENVTFDSNTLYGLQEADDKYYEYYNNTNNTMIFTNGIGISMNLKDNSTNYNLLLKCNYKITGSNPKIFGTYQHATSNITLNQSKNYTISANGFGNVIKFSSSVEKYYDKTPGLNATG